jgi:hypothetical protein
MLALVVKFRDRAESEGLEPGDFGGSATGDAQQTLSRIPLNGAASTRSSRWPVPGESSTMTSRSSAVMTSIASRSAVVVVPELSSLLF